MVSADGALDWLTALFDRLPQGVEGDARLRGHAFTTMRFANGRIHQPHVDSAVHLSFRVLDDGRLATATTSDLRPRSIAVCLRTARALARAAPEDPRFPGFSAASRPVKTTAHSDATARARPALVARMAREALEGAESDAPRARVAGVVNVGGEWLAVANSEGLRRFSRRSLAQSSVLAEYPDRDPPVSGWSEAGTWDHERLDVRGLGREAAGRIAPTAPARLPPGEYPVVLAGSAVADLVAFLAFLGFGVRAEEERWSALSGRRGKRVASREVTLTDDATSPETVPQSIDFEGTAKRRTVLLDRGVACPAVTDLATAGHLGRKSTGHALPPESPAGDFGPVPCHLRLEAGPGSLSDLMSAVRRGVLVSRFHYVRPVHPQKSIITGMTRDGTYEIRDGGLGPPVRNLRFTESILRALSGVRLVGRDLRCYADERGGAQVTCPAVALDSFRFTSTTLF